MYETPQKELPNKISSLRNRIQQKLSTDKKKIDIKQNIFKIYHSHTKNNHQTFFHSKLKQSNIQPQNQTNYALKQNNYLGLSNHNISKPKITQNNILQFESLQNRNFYGFNQWIQFNHKFFSHVNQKYVKALWKIMRIINYGDVWIPSGLIFQLSKIFIQNQYGGKSTIKQVLNQFLKFNHASDQVNNFRQLKNLYPFEQIEQNYKKQKNIQRQSTEKKGKQYSSLKKLPSNQNVFQRAYNESKIRNQKKNLNIYKSLVQKQINQQFSFKPKINQYQPQKIYVDQSTKQSRICNSHNKYLSDKFFQQNITTADEFKAKPFNKSVFQMSNLDDIPGVSQFIDRKKSSQAQKRKIQRYMQKPNLVFKHD